LKGVSTNGVTVQPITTTVDAGSGGQSITVQKVSVRVQPATTVIHAVTKAPNKIIEVGRQGPAGPSGVTENVILAGESTPGSLAIGDIVQPDVSLDRGVKKVNDNKEDWPAIGIVTEVQVSGACKFLYIGFSAQIFSGFSRGDRAWVGTSGTPQDSVVSDGWAQEIGYCYQDTLLFVDFSRNRLKRSPF